MIKRSELEKIMYGCLTEVRDVTRVERLLDAAYANAGDPREFWNTVRVMTSNVTSDHAMGRWQTLSEVVYRHAFKPMYVHGGAGDE